MNVLCGCLKHTTELCFLHLVWGWYAYIQYMHTCIYVCVYCIYIRTYTCIRKCTYTCIHIYTYVCTDVRMFMYICMYVCMYTYVHSYICVRMYVYIYYVCTYVSVYTYTLVYVPTYAVHSYIHFLFCTVYFPTCVRT